MHLQLWEQPHAASSGQQGQQGGRLSASAWWGRGMGQPPVGNWGSKLDPKHNEHNTKSPWEFSGLRIRPLVL